MHRLHLANDPSWRMTSLTTCLLLNTCEGLFCYTLGVCLDANCLRMLWLWSAGTNCTRFSSTSALGPEFQNASQYSPDSSFYQVRFPSNPRMCWQFYRGMSCSNICPFPHKCNSCSRNHPANHYDQVFNNCFQFSPLLFGCLVNYLSHIPIRSLILSFLAPPMGLNLDTEMDNFWHQLPTTNFRPFITTGIFS